MKELESIERYLRILGAYAESKLSIANSSDAGKTFLENNSLALLGLSDETDIKEDYSALNKDDIFLSELFRKLNEILDAYFRLEETFCLTSRPKKTLTTADIVFNNKYSTRLKTVRLRMEHQIKTLYIMSNRMLNLLDWIENKYKKHSSTETKHILQKAISMKAGIKNTFVGVRNRRHVHEHETFFNEADIKMVERIATFYYASSINGTTGDNPDAFKEYLNEEYEKVKTKYTKVMRLNIRDSKKYLNIFLNDLFDVLLDNNDMFHVPFKLTTPVRESIKK